MVDTSRILLVAVVLAGAGLGVFAWRLARIDPTEPERLVGELRLSQWLTIVLAVIGGAWLAMSVNSSHPAAPLDLTTSLAVVLCAGWLMLRDTRQSLLWLCAVFLAHAILDTAHRPGWLPADAAPRWFALGCAAFNVYLSLVCFWVRR
jgi:hypothetical protein